MKKRVISLFLSMLMLVSSMSAFSVSVEAASYKETLKNKGFTSSYISALTELHKKYPKWQFEPFITGLNWADAVAGERSYHSKQVIQKQSSLNSGYYCNCDKCYKNGSYVIQEGSSWVSASEATVKYYLDPRNWLDEKAIFQFESTAYNDNQTINGVESIISSTWMADAYITYKDKNGKTQTYKNSKGNKVKYSTAIMQGAKNSSMSAYYLASKIVQEVGGAKNTAGGASGTYSGYEGIYNYYNIGAYTGAADGLKWASLDTTTYKTNCECYLRKEPNTSSSKVKLLSYGTTLTYVATTAKQSDGYKWYQVKVKDGSKTYSGYVRSDLVTVTTPTYNRPWTNPYLSIVNGASFIAKSFSTYQFTGYLQKFNVNKNSNNLYNHEYMANVQAAVSEAKISYNAYNKADILSSSKVFYIPVFKNMPSKACPAPSKSSSDNPSTTEPTTASTKVTGLKLTGSTTVNLSYSWSKVDGATKYHLYITNVGRGTSFEKYVTTNSATLNNLTEGNQYSVKVRAYVGGWKEYSEAVKNKTLTGKTSGVKVTSCQSTTASLKWSKTPYADGYIVYRLTNGKYTKFKTVKGGSTLSVKLTGLTAGMANRFRVAAYVDNYRAGAMSGYVTAKTFPQKVTGVKLTPTSTTIKVSWSKVGGYADGYRVSFARDKAFKDVIATKTVEGQSKLTYTGKNLTKGRSYYVRVRAYKKIGDKTFYGTWSDVIKTTCK